LQRVAQNTAALFARQIIMALISLYTVRLLLQGLGITDYGVLSAALSVATLLSFVTGSIGMIAQRYIAFAIGEGSQANIKRYHDASLFMTIVSAVFIFALLETAGLWFVSQQMTIKPDRYDAVTMLYQLLILHVVVGTLTCFHSSVVLAHEDMHVFALLSILGAVLRLVAAFSIAFFALDTLVTYGFLLLVTELIVALAQWSYCARRYEECAFGRVSIDFVTLREMVGFTRWTLFGQFTTVCRTQAITLLINQAFSPATVAARALSFTIYSQVQTFSQNFTSALNPPITKAYASGNREQTFALIILGSRLAFFLSWIVTLPLIALLPGILNLWLETYPAETVLFSRLALLEGLILSISFPLMAAARAVGDMRSYELILGGMQILVLVLSYLLVLGGFPAYWIFLVAIAINIVMFFVRLWLTSRLIGLSAQTFLKQAVLPAGVVAALSVAAVVGFLTAFPGSGKLEPSFSSLGIAFVIALTAPIFIVVFGASQAERKTLLRMVRRKLEEHKMET
jgi:O-antigen/teichoic acid export membrane protein